MLTVTSAPKYVSVVAGGYALIGGLVSLSGWALGIQRLTDWNGSGIAMKANTAVAIAVAGAALVVAVIRPGARRLVRGLGLFVAVVGGLTLLQHLTGWNLGLDMLLFDEAPGAPATRTLHATP